MHKKEDTTMTDSNLMIGITGSVYDAFGNRLGSASAGKDTVGSLITEMVQNASTFAFADPVKNAALLINPIVTSSADKTDKAAEQDEPARLIHLSEIVNEIGWDRAKRTYPEIRRILQRVGTDAGWQLHQNPTLWIELTDSTITAAAQNWPGPMVPVLTDVRFAHEAKYIRSQGGQIIDVMRVLSTAQDAEAYLAAHPHNTAASETEVLASDYSIFNNGDLAELRTRVEHYLKHNRYGQAVNKHS